MSKGKSDRTNTLGFYQLEMISKEVIPTETLKWEKDALDFSILGKKKILSGCIPTTNIETKHQSCSVKVFTNLIPMVSLVPFPSLSPREG